MAPASEIVHPACDQIDGRPAAGIKVRDIFLFVRIDGDQDALLFCLSLAIFVILLHNKNITNILQFYCELLSRINILYKKNYYYEEMLSSIV